MEKHFFEEIPIAVEGIPDHHEWWTIGMDTDGDVADCFASCGGIRHTDLPICVLKIALPKWAEWIAKL